MCRLYFLDSADASRVYFKPVEEYILWEAHDYKRCLNMFFSCVFSSVTSVHRTGFFNLRFFLLDVQTIFSGFCWCFKSVFQTNWGVHFGEAHVYERCAHNMFFCILRFVLLDVQTIFCGFCWCFKSVFQTNWGVHFVRGAWL